jgi:hypothetical protein
MAFTNAALLGSSYLGEYAVRGVVFAVPQAGWVSGDPALRECGYPQDQGRGQLAVTHEEEKRPSGGLVRAAL